MEPLGADDPRQVGAYRLLRRLGAGGMGRVYLGRTAGGRTVAVKVVRAELADDAEFRARFRQEVGAARRVGGAWTAPVLDADTDGSQPWIATGYVAGPSLSDAVESHGPLPEGSVRALGAGLAEALAAVHEAGLVHRDVKPSNVLLAMDGPRLIDFGIARALDATASLTRSGVVVGSPGYMSPEQVTGRPVGPETDVFSLGTLLVFAALGRGPFSGDSAAVLLYKVAHEEPEMDGLGGVLRQVAEACMDKDPAHRPSPRRIAAMLAPESGAAPLFRAGWLPAPLVDALSRGTAELLDLDAESAPAPSGFGPPPSPSVHPAYTSGSGVHDRVPTYAGQQQAASGGFQQLSHTATGQPPTGAQPPRRRRRRRIAAAVAAGFAVAVSAVAAAVFLLPQDGKGEGGSGDGRAGGGKSSGKPADQGRTRGEVPEAFIGKWTGRTTTEAGVPGTFQITIREGSVGSVVAEDKSEVPLLNVDCGGKWKLRSAKDDRIVLDTSGGPNPHPGICSEGSANERFTLKPDGTLRFESGDDLAGRPKGDLHKVE